MTFPSSAVPTLRARVLPKFPALVQVSPGLTLTKSGLTYTFALDAANMPVVSSVRISPNGYIDWGAGDVRATHSANLLAFTGGTVSFDSPVIAPAIAFPATQVPSADPNTFDDYEENIWTPTITFATPGDLNVAYTTRLGAYTKKGREVTLTFQIATSTFTFTTASGNLSITGLPFTNNAVITCTGTLRWQGITKANYTHISPIVLAGGNTIQLSASGSAQAVALIAAADTPTGGNVILTGTLTYHV